MSGASWARGQPDGGDHRQPKRQEREKRRATINPPGYDAGKRIKGKKRHILLDTLSLMLRAVVHNAGLQDRDGGVLVMATLFGMFPFLRQIYADGGFKGPVFQTRLKRVLRQVEVQIVKRSEAAKGFLVLPQRVRGSAPNRRTQHRLAQSLPQAGQGLGEPQPHGVRVPATRLDPTHAAKAMQSKLMFRGGRSDKLHPGAAQAVEARLDRGRSVQPEWRRHAAQPHHPAGTQPAEQLRRARPCQPG